ncbi:FtsX-like permease family protein [Paractinoplanes globisporus]|uniref:FtsX-like permease family protein n=1 Tax=Paractinoplanes globisporus TaxID=113565 RepID=A0ABW6WRV7_9ACTN|nr:FtsX-like permease family protein [Actinoplanes globisporus]
MYFVSWGAVRRRTTQAALLTLLATLAAIAAASGPWYGLTVASRAAGAEVEARPAAERVINVHQPPADTGGDPRKALDALAARVQGLLTLRGSTPILGLTQNTVYTDVRHGSAPSGMPIAYRDGFCANVHLTGACPSAPSTVAISADVAKRLQLKPGDTFPVRPDGAYGTMELHVVGVYVAAGDYWTDKLFQSQGDLDPVFTPLDTFRLPELGKPTLAVSLPVPFPLLRGDNLYDLNGVLNAAAPRFAAAQLDLENPTGDLSDAVIADRRTVLTGVLVALAQLLVLAWFALAMAGRLTGRDRREDAGLLKLRGATRGGLMRLTAGQHVPPLLLGAAIGLPIGIAAAWLVAGDLPVRAEWWIALVMSVGAVLAVAAGGLLVLTGTDALAHRAPVIALLRRVPSLRRDWRSRFVDLAFLLLAAGAVYQARTGGPTSGLGVAAPALVALAVGLLLARLLRWVTDRAGGAAIRAGRVRLGLTAVQVSRQPGTDRVLALLVVAVALLALTAGGLSAARQERVARADVELGAARVLTVRADSRTHLLAAVREADPGGRQAMAVVVDTAADPPVLAVDSSRLAAVATHGSDFAPLAAAARAIGDTPLITGRTLTVRLTRDTAGPALLGAILRHEGTGDGLRVEFRGLRPGAQEVTAAVPACAVAPGCRFVGWQLFPAAGGLTITSVGQRSPAATVLDAGLLGDVSLWHADYLGIAPRFATSARGLTVEADARSGSEVRVADAPVPLPIVLAGKRPEQWRFDDAMSGRFGGTATPVRVVATAGVLPVLGRTGIVTDLDAARRLAGDADLGGTFQVWLADNAPASVLAALRAAGLTVTADRTAAARATALGEEGRFVTEPFGILTTAIAVLVAAAMIGVSVAAEREPREAMVAALRMQGLSRGTAAFTGRAGTAGLVLAGVAGGLIAALVARPVAAITATPFPDHWRILEPPGVLPPGVLALTAGAGLVVLGATALVATRRRVR